MEIRFWHVINGFALRPAVFPDPKAITSGVIVFNTYCDWSRTRQMIQASSISPQTVCLEIAIQFNSSEKE
jgi:hypothetical protein